MKLSCNPHDHLYVRGAVFKGSPYCFVVSTYFAYRYGAFDERFLIQLFKQDFQQGYPQENHQVE
jgi:hypothetical protein